jgi:hypothetical protein
VPLAVGRTRGMEGEADTLAYLKRVPTGKVVVAAGAGKIWRVRMRKTLATSHGLRTGVRLPRSRR